MKNSKIEWTHHTFNPWWGCTKVSDACAHCYAETFAKRTGHDVWGPEKPRRFFGDKHWEAPLLWNDQAKKAGERQRVFCASMADVFEDYSGPDHELLKASREQLWHLIQITPNLDWLLLTKRPENILVMVPRDWLPSSLPPNIWIGTTVENQEQANKRIPELLKVPAKVRFLSCEPLLEAVEITPYIGGFTHRCKCPDDPGRTLNGYHFTEYSTFGTARKFYCKECGELCETRPACNWIICGGESGPGSRPMHPDWARSLRDQCQAAQVPFFFKQWGDWLPHGQGFCDTYHEQRIIDPTTGDKSSLPQHGTNNLIYRIGKAKAGRLLDGQEHNEIPT